MLLVILFYLFIITGIINMIHFAAFLVGANLYDMGAFKSSSRSKKNKPGYKPLVSVLVPAHNEEKVIERCLQSVWSNTYDNIEIIVINDGSVDATSDVVRKFNSQRSRVYAPSASKIVRTKNGLKRVWRRGNSQVYRKIKLVEQRNSGKGSALNNAIRNHAKGELVMTLDADSLLHNRAIANAVKYFESPEIVGVAANVRIIEENSVLGILQRFEHMVSYRSKKFYTVTNCELIVGGVASTYRRSVLDEVGHYDTDTQTEDIGLSIKIAAQGNKKNRLVYAADVAAMTEGVADLRTLFKQRYRWKLGNMQNIYKYRSIAFSKNDKYTKMLSWYRMPMAMFGELMLLMEPLALAFVAYLSIKYLTINLVLGAYLMITAYILMTIWPDEHLSRPNKIKASFYAPLLYFIFYIMNAVQVISALRCIRNYKNIRQLGSQESTWVSPTRAGRQVADFS